MDIQGIDRMSGDQLAFELERGGRFVMFEYCISLVIVTFKRPSDIFFIRSGKSAVTKGLGYTFLSLIFGWWGIPWGPIYTIGSVFTNLSGGKDVTDDVLASLSEAAEDEEE